jgi:hypothetical protein
MLMGWATQKKGSMHEKKPLLLQLVKDNFKYLWRHRVDLLFPAI